MLTIISTRIASLLWKLWYPLLTRLSKNAPLTFLNYGYADLDPNQPPLPLNPQDEPNRPCIQLYHRVAAAIDFHNRDLLEISCGHGGGANYLANYLHPRSLHAIDRNPAAIALCKSRHHHPALTFRTGNAQSLPFPDHTFDVVINIEASHCYPNLPQFLSEVHRVLRPAGHFLYADFRPTPQVPLLDHQLEQSGLQLLSRTNITPNVLRGMQLNTEKYLTLIHRLIPKPLQKPASHFAGTKGSPIYNALESGHSTYLCYHLQKSANGGERDRISA